METIYDLLVHYKEKNVVLKWDSTNYVVSQVHSTYVTLSRKKTNEQASIMAHIPLNSISCIKETRPKGLGAKTTYTLVVID